MDIPDFSNRIDELCEHSTIENAKRVLDLPEEIRGAKWIYIKVLELIKKREAPRKRSSGATISITNHDMPDGEL